MKPKQVVYLSSGLVLIILMVLVCSREEGTEREENSPDPSVSMSLGEEISEEGSGISLEERSEELPDEASEDAKAPQESAGVELSGDSSSPGASQAESASQPATASSSATVSSSETPSSSETGSSEQPGPSEEPRRHEHEWTPVTQTVFHEAEGHYETVHHEAQTHEEPVYEGVVVCSDCGAEFFGDNAVQNWGLHCDEGYDPVTNTTKCGSYHVEQRVKETVTVVDAEAYDEEVYVVDVPAYEETVITGYVCAICGASYPD